MRKYENYLSASFEMESCVDLHHWRGAEVAQQVAASAIWDRFPTRRDAKSQYNDTAS